MRISLSVFIVGGAAANLSFGVGSGMLIAVPFLSSLGGELELAISQALSDAQ